jgi:hypothetical protein
MKPARIAVAAAVVLALVSAWHSGAHMWQRVQNDYRTYSPYTPTERKHAAATAFGLDGDIFDFYADFLGRGDRFYVQVDAGHNPDAVRMFAGYYLLPAVEVGDPSRATVVISYWTDPGTLGIHYLTQREAGLQPIFVSRISAP